MAATPGHSPLTSVPQTGLTGNTLGRSASATAPARPGVGVGETLFSGMVCVCVCVMWCVWCGDVVLRGKKVICWVNTLMLIEYSITSTILVDS